MRKETSPAHVYWIEKGTLTGEADGKQGHRIVEADGQRLMYSAHDRIPDIGETINVPMNKFGEARVLGYFHEDGFFGVLCQPRKPPKWFTEQEHRDRKRDNPVGIGNIGVFGAEFDFPTTETGQRKTKTRTERTK